MDIKIIVATHKHYWMPDDPVYLPLQVGAEGKTDLGYIADNTGDNISSKNANFCELTGMYWAWKNVRSDYIGMVHYRRYFTRKEVRNIDNKKRQILTVSEWEILLAKYSVVVSDKRRYYIESNRSHYNHAHHQEGLDMTEKIIRETYPAYVSSFEKVMSRTWAHMFNMFVMRRDLLDSYMTWLFGILETLEKYLNLQGYDRYQQRVFGFVAERLLDVWLEKNQISYIEQNVSFMENQNWLKKSSAFLIRKFIHIHNGR
ncbi:exopolysaccharide biosynthesis protein [Megasphaera cerevisiae DSM 20462]|uniref:Exopolysaccharide biosynthesis protein n=1 Tax=Megasphaera cerevisiae DSM 20462 TaxID=1122219 RepID=A0A0J6WR95_9FIRM|nr:DUF4422 domain-containing protein [Megasphaera cerevisiae]KMO85980.1 exopolysaccharide biosynthesis protein [Megasphaera cerevisiae DSM 20462]SKA13181.1 protein of unknown function [Megasphaera cerevisiae DSM 20462]